MKISWSILGLLLATIIEALQSSNSSTAEVTSFHHRIVEGKRKKSNPHNWTQSKNTLKPRASIRNQRQGHTRPFRKTPEYQPHRYENKKRSLHVSIDQQWTSSTTGSIIKNQTKYQRRHRDRDAERNFRKRLRKLSRSLSISEERNSRKHHRRGHCKPKKPHCKKPHRKHSCRRPCKKRHFHRRRHHCLRSTSSSSSY